MGSAGGVKILISGSKIALGMALQVISDGYTGVPCIHKVFGIVGKVREVRQSIPRLDFRVGHYMEHLCSQAKKILLHTFFGQHCI